MSGLIYPSNLPGLTWESSRALLFKTKIKEAVSGKESRMTYQVYPRFLFELQYEFLRHNLTPSELKSISGLFAQMYGNYDTFLYTDPVYNTVTDEPFGTGDGSTTAFQLVATFQNTGGPGLAEIIQNLNGTPVIKKAGVTQTTPANYSIGATGLVTFTSAPGSGQALTWSGSFYYRCRFDDDSMTFNQFMKDFWRARRVRLKSIKL